jgi:ATP-dependent RNA helicase DeaD
LKDNGPGCLKREEQYESGRPEKTATFFDSWEVVLGNMGKTQSGFDDFRLRPELAQALADRGFTNPTPVQERVLSDENALLGDLIVQAKTGSGKTLAFALPILNEMDAGESLPRVLVLSPTRELALQTAQEFESMAKPLRIRIAALVGGMDMETQLRRLKEGAGVLVGTPGRVLDHIRRKAFDCGSIHTVVLDEGDHMLDMGFRDELEAILDSLPSRERTWLFSATMPEEVVKLSSRYLSAPRWISLVEDTASHEDIAHRAYLIPSGRRVESLINVLLWEAPERALVFCPTRIETAEVAERLQGAGFSALPLHGDMGQKERNTALGAFRAGRVRILVSTDVAARGIDVEGISHVIQLGLPGTLDNYVHRSGRTGRAGNEGLNLSLLTPRDARTLKSLLRGHSLSIEWLSVPDSQEIRLLERGRLDRELAECEEQPSEMYLEWAREILGRNEAECVVARLLERLFAQRSSGFALRRELDREMEAEERRRLSKRDGKVPSRAGTRREETGGATRLRLEKGRADGVEVGALLGVLCRALKVDRREIGNIRLRDRFAEVELGERAARHLERYRKELEKEGFLSPEGSLSGRKPRPGSERERASHRSAL